MNIFRSKTLRSTIPRLRRWARLSTRPANRFKVSDSAVPEIIANRIIAAAKNGERDVARLYEQALQAFCIEDKPMLLVSVGRDIPDPAYAPVAHAA